MREIIFSIHTYDQSKAQRIKLFIFTFGFLFTTQYSLTHSNHLGVAINTLQTKFLYFDTFTCFNCSLPHHCHKLFKVDPPILSSKCPISRKIMYKNWIHYSLVFFLSDEWILSKMGWVKTSLFLKWFYQTGWFLNKWLKRLHATRIDFGWFETHSIRLTHFHLTKVFYLTR